MTLGPKFFSCNKMTITRRTKHLRRSYRCSSKRNFAYYAVALSKRGVLKKEYFLPKGVSLCPNLVILFYLI